MAKINVAKAKVSIHAPAWGATGCSRVAVPNSARFNPRARVGRDDPTTIVTFDQASFNPRARVGRDILPIEIDGVSESFNPRARVGRDRFLPAH